MKSKALIFFLLGWCLLSVSVLSGQTVSDADGDLVPDAVETLWGMNPNDPADALLDLDGDGLNAQQEYAFGGDPAVRDQAIEIDPQLKELKVRELVNSETVRPYLGWSEDLTDWNREGFSQVANASDQVLSSSLVNLDSPIGTVREWTYQLAGDGNVFFRTEIESTGYAPVFRKLHKGVNLDVSRVNSGVWPKSQHQAAQMQAIAEAGFESVRIFTTYFSNVSETEQQIDDALEKGLAIVVCLWGLNSWAGNVSLGEQQIAQKWGEMASRWKDYPADLVFEILNEPRGIGFQDGIAHANAMRLYNAAAQAIRDEDPDRPILMGGPGHNDSEFLDPYVTEEHLTYTFDGGKGFNDDRNVGVAIHFYNPKHADGLNFAMWTAPLGNDESRWKDPITEQVMYAVDWRASEGVDIPIITTEWGAWMFPTRDASGDLEKWLAHHFDLFETHDIGSMWYTGIQHNQRAFAIFDTELGWHPIVTPVLTGQEIPTFWPNIDQMINGEFFSEGGWLLSTDAITSTIQNGSAFSGNSMMKLTVPEFEGGGQLYLQSLVTNSEPSERTLFHLIEGVTYRISFIARSEGGDGLLKVLLKDVGSGTVFYESAETSIGSSQQSYEFFYTHNTADAMDVRFEFEVGSKAQVLYLDKVVFIRHGSSGYSVTVNTDSGTSVVDYSVGSDVQIDALPAPDGYFFNQWTFEPSVPPGANTGEVSTSFNMPANDLTATAVYMEGSSPSYSLTVNTNSVSNVVDVELGETVVLDAGLAPEGQVFDEWTFAPSVPSGADTASSSTSFSMPSNDLTATASYRDFVPVNLVANGDFAQGAGSWGLWLNDADASYAVEAGEAVISITSSGGGIAKPQFVQQGIGLEDGGEYTLSFRGRAESDKQVTVYYTPGIFVGDFDLTTEMQTFSATFTTTVGTGRLDFLLGANDADVFLDDISIVEGSGEGGG